MAAARIKSLFQEVENHDPEFKQWLANVVVGAILADHFIAEEELPYLEQLKQSLANEPEIVESIQAREKSLEIPPLEHRDIDPDLADEVFECLYEICGCDSILDPAEFDYLRRASKALGIEYPHF